MKNQDNKCKACRKKSKHWDFDHIDGDSSNNRLENSQALCPNCHDKKTRKTNQKNTRLLQIVGMILRKINKKR